MKKKKWLWLLAAVVGIAVITPSYVRAYRVAGSSDAPTYLVGELIFVNKAAYDLKLPYTDVALLSYSEPESGDVVMFRAPDDDMLVFKRIVGGPGETVVMDSNRLEIDGVPLRYELVSETEFEQVAESNELGSVIETEIGYGPSHLITHTPGVCHDASFAPVEIPPGHYFMLGDNRDKSKDSREYGPVPRDLIIGKVVRP